MPKTDRAQRRDRTPPTAQAVHAAYLPDVPFESLCGMALGKDAPSTPAEHARVITRIKREADLRLQSQATRQDQKLGAMSEGERQAYAADLLGL